MDEWKTSHLGDVAHLKMGQAPAGAHVTDLDSGLPFLQGNSEFGARCPTATLQCDAAPRRSAPGDSLISVRAPVGAINRSDREYGIGRGLAAVMFDAVDSDFGHHALVERSSELHRVSQGTTFSAIGRTELAALELLIPPFEEQRRIAEILDTIDETIQAAERVIAKLDIALAALDQVSFSGEGTGGQVRLGDECRVFGGKRLPAGHAYSTTPAQYRYLRVVDFYRQSVDYGSLAALSKPTFEALSRYEIRPGELFISIAGSIGYVGVNEPPAGIRTILTENAARIVPSDSFIPAFLALQMNSRGVRDQVRAEIGVGAGVPKLALHRVANLRVSCPELSIQQEVVQRHQAWRTARYSEISSVDKLRKLRSGLASDLLSGRVRTVPA